MKIGIVGSRSFRNYLQFRVDLEILFNSNFDPIERIITGGSSGTDSLAMKFALRFDIDLTIFWPGWDKYGKAAGLKRNSLIVRDSDCLIAFWDGKSKGTLDTIHKANKAGKDVFLRNVS